MQKVSDAIASFLKEKEIKHIFSMVGIGNVHILDSINKLGYTEIICIHHEQAAVMAMIGYYRATGKVGAAIVTAGAGSTNTFTGLVSGWMDSVPGIIIAGNEKTKFTYKENPLRVWGVQGYDSVAMAEKYTKLAIRVTDPQQILNSLNIAYNKSLESRAGMSWIEIPIDVQSEIVNEVKLNLELMSPVIETSEINPQIQIIQDMLNASKRPVLWLGHGIRLAHAQELVLRLVEKLQIPVLVSWAGADLLDYDNEFNFGSAGICGLRSANFVLQNCDLLITIGTRLSIMQVGHELSEFARQAKLVVNDIDFNEIHKLGSRVALPVVCDSGLFIRKLIDKVDLNKANYADWLSYCKQMQAKYPRVGFDNQDKNGYINSHKFIEKLSGYLRPSQLVTTDMGTALISAHHALCLKDGQRLFTSTGLGEMGYGLPAAIGASIATGKSEVVCLNCDGGMMLNLQELQTMVHHELPIKLFIFTNDGYLMTKHIQNAWFKGTYSATNKKSGVTCPEYSRIANAFNIKYYAISTWEDFDKYMEEVMSIGQACICEVFIDPDQIQGPKVVASVKKDGSLVIPPLEDTTPLISLDEMRGNMLIGLHQKSLDLSRSK